MSLNNPTSVSGDGFDRKSNSYVRDFSIWCHQMTDGSVGVGSKAGGEIAELYNDGIPGNLLNHSKVDELELWWWLNNRDSVTSVADRSGNSQNGVPRNLTVGSFQNTAPGY
jgi:hypothetical protein